MFGNVNCFPDPAQFRLPSETYQKFVYRNDENKKVKNSFNFKMIGAMASHLTHERIDSLMQALASIQKQTTPLQQFYLCLSIDKTLASQYDLIITRIKTI